MVHGNMTALFFFFFFFFCTVIMTGVAGGAWRSEAQCTRYNVITRVEFGHGDGLNTLHDAKVEDDY